MIYKHFCLYVFKHGINHVLNQTLRVIYNYFYE